MENVCRTIFQMHKKKYQSPYKSLFTNTKVQSKL